jgi:glucosamine-6-phosphate deaminase
MMNLIVTADYAAMSQAAADFVTKAVAAKPDAVAVFPTGNSPLGLYQELARRRQQGLFNPSQLRIFQLDEYLGISADDPRSLYGWFKQACLAPLGVPETNVRQLAGDAPDLVVACRAYDQALAAVGGLDLAVLGLGPNGHLGYNEPPATGDAPTRVITLTEESITSAAHYFGGRDQVPRHALTCGMAQLLAARQILLIVSGAHKRDILWRSLKGPITPEVPASYLQQAASVTVLADRAAWPERSA